MPFTSTAPATGKGSSVPVVKRAPSPARCWAAASRCMAPASATEYKKAGQRKPAGNAALPNKLGIALDGLPVCGGVLAACCAPSVSSSVL